MGVTIGVDSHKSTLAAAAVDEVGAVLSVMEFANERRGHVDLARWAAELGSVRIGIECSGSYGAALGRHLTGSGQGVVEVPAFMAHREAGREPSRGKADPSDAVAIARVAAREQRLPLISDVAVAEDLQLLSCHRRGLQEDRTKLLNQIHKDLVVLCPGYERAVPDLTRKGALSDVMRLVRGDRSVRADLVRDRIKDVRRVEGKVKEADARIKVKLEESQTSLMGLVGIGPTMAAVILGEVKDVTRFRSEAAFAMFCGAAPLQASSGKTTRHRLNRRSNRQLNRALYVMALTQARSNGPARAFVQRKMAEGKSWKEAIRCLKRHLARAIYRRLIADSSRARAAAA